MKVSRQVFLAAALLLSASAAEAQVSSASAVPPGTIPLTSLIATVAKNTGRKFVLDPRVRAGVTLVGEEPSRVTYDELLTILDTYGFSAFEAGGYVQVVPDAYMREEPLPLITDKEKLPDDEYVTTVFHVRSVPVAWLIPLLRPMVPQQGHLVALPCVNSVIIVDRFANLRRLESVIKALDTGAPIKPQSCSYRAPGEGGGPG